MLEISSIKTNAHSTKKSVIPYFVDTDAVQTWLREQQVKLKNNDKNYNEILVIDGNCVSASDIFDHIILGKPASGITVHNVQESLHV